MDAHFAGFLAKPITGSTLLDVLVRLFAREQAPVEPVPMVTAQVDLTGRRLLLAEDNPINAQIAVELLRMQRVDVDVVENGAEAVARIQGGQRYDAVLMDIQMPVMDGYAATRALRAGGATLPILAMTAHALDADRVACLEAGMNAHITKPLDPARLVRTLEELLRGVSGAPDAHAVEAPRREVPASDEASSVLDVERGLRLVGGNAALQMELFTRFVDHHAADAERFEAALGTGDTRTAARIVHTVRGVAGNLGAMALADAAGRPERRLAEAPLPALDAVADLRATLQDTVARMRACIASDDATGPERRASPPRDDAAHAEAMRSVHDLLAMLRAADGRSAARARAIQDDLVHVVGAEAADGIVALTRNFALAEAARALTDSLRTQGGHP